MGDIKEGVSVQEIESFAKEYTNEIMIVIAIIIGTISSIFDWFTGPKLSLLIAGIFVVISVGLPTQIDHIKKMTIKSLYKQNMTMEMIIGIVRILFAIFIPFVLFAEIGFLAGAAYDYYIKKPVAPIKIEKEESPTSENEEEHI